MNIKGFFFQIRICVLFIAMITLFSCKNNIENQIQQENSDSLDQKASLEDGYLMLLPSAMQIFNQYKKSGLDYRHEIINPTTNSSKYNTNLSKSLNVGVYTADLSYLLLNSKLSEANSYIKTIKEVSEDIGMSNVVSEGNINRFEKNISNRDSLLAVIANVKEQMDVYFNLNENKHKKIIFFIGTYVEGLYISMVNYNESDKNLKDIITYQLSILGNLNIMLSEYPNKNESVNMLLRDMSALNEIYENIKSVDEKDKSSNMDLTDLNTKIKEIRSNIVTGKF